jgi:hypothetical protein
MRPKSVLVGPHRYRLVFNKAETDRRSLAEGEVRLGECDHRALTILVDPTQAETQIKDTLLHETLHACMSLIGATEDISEQIEERLVLRLAPVLLQVLGSNPRLVAYLTAT